MKVGIIGAMEQEVAILRSQLKTAKLLTVLVVRFIQAKLMALTLRY